MKGMKNWKIRTRKVTTMKQIIFLKVYFNDSKRNLLPNSIKRAFGDNEPKFPLKNVK